MRAVLLTQFGGPDRLVVRDVPAPVAGPGKVLVRVAAASVTFVETQLRAGRGPSPAHLPTLPVILGNGVAGVVVAVGAGVDPGLAGARVVSTTGGSGGYAELAAVDAAELITVPDRLDLTDAAALLADGRTAIGLTRAAAPAPGEWVLVEAAGGGVGSLLVQLTRAAGARVIGAASRPHKRQLADDLGAELTVDYTRPDWTDRVRAATGGTGVDLAFDGVGGDIGRAAFGLVRDGGRFCISGMASGSFTELPRDRRGIDVTGLGAVPNSPEQLRELSRSALAAAAEGRLRATIGQTFPLERAADAHGAIEARTSLGKTLLVP
jgi:NADPH:quinone reductase